MAFLCTVYGGAIDMKGMTGKEYQGIRLRDV